MPNYDQTPSQNYAQGSDFDFNASVDLLDRKTERTKVNSSVMLVSIRIDDGKRFGSIERT